MRELIKKIEEKSSIDEGENEELIKAKVRKALADVSAAQKDIKSAARTSYFGSIGYKKILLDISNDLNIQAGNLNKLQKILDYGKGK